MTTIIVTYVNQAQQGEGIVRAYECKDTLGKPTFPIWPLPLTDGRVVLINMAMAYDIVLHESKIKTPSGDEKRIIET